MARVGVDLDGVLYPFEDELRKYLGKPDLPAATQWDFYEEWGLTRGEFVELCEEALRDKHLFYKGFPYLGTIEQVDRLMAAGHEVVFITNRAFISVDECRKATESWLTNWWTDDRWELHLVADKTTVPVDYMIDDNEDNFMAMREAGVNAFLCARPWNIYAKQGQRGTLEQYVDLVLACESDSHNGHSTLDGNNEIRVTSATGGQKGKKLARFGLIPPEALWQVAELYGKGAEKYDDWNWRKGYDWSLSIDALERHLSEFKRGNDYDAETGCHQLTAVVFHALTLLTFAAEHPEYDDRYKSDA